MVCAEICSRKNNKLLELSVKVDYLIDSRWRNSNISEEIDEDWETQEDKIKQDLFKNVLGIEVKSLERIHNMKKYHREPHRLVLHDFMAVQKKRAEFARLQETER